MDAKKHSSISGLVPSAIAAIVKAAHQLGEGACTVEVNGTAVQIFVPDHYRFETTVNKQRLARLQAIPHQHAAISHN